jgi:hypothetical protein
MSYQSFNLKRVENKAYLSGQKLRMIEVTRKNGGMITRADVIRLSKKIRDDYRKTFSDGVVIVSIRYPNRWYSGSKSTLKDDPEIFSMNGYDEFDEDPEEYTMFRFHFFPSGAAAAAGGAGDPNNDCLITCIQSLVQSHRRELDAAELKDILGLERDAKIPLSMIPQVEGYIRQKTGSIYGINVTGDHAYTSSLPTTKKIRLVLTKEHYSVEKEAINKKCIAFEDKQIVMYELVDDSIVCFDGADHYMIERELYDEFKSNPISSKVILVNRYFCAATKRNIPGSSEKLMSMEEAFEYYIEMANELKAETKGAINFFRCGSIKDMALHYFYQKVKSVQPDHVSNTEADWIRKASFGATTYWEPFQGQLHSYDINSHYPSIMTKNYNYFPIQEGEYCLVHSIPTKKSKNGTGYKAQFGIYRCEITKQEGDTRPFKFFRFNKSNYYTNLDIDVARQYGLHVKMVDDGSPNFLCYTEDKLANGAFLFKHYMTELYALKERKVKGAKDILNVLWGALCEKRVKKRKVDYDEELHMDDAEMLSIYATDSKLHFRFLSYEHGMFMTNFARVGPFVLAYGRDRLYHSFQKYEADIVRIHTDGFYITRQPEDIMTGTALGHLKYEGIKEVNIRGLNKVKP